jgi:hypothetical protein
MNRTILISIISASLVSAQLSIGHAGEVTLPKTFTAGAPARAAEVNANFTAGNL